MANDINEVVRSYYHRKHLDQREVPFDECYASLAGAAPKIRTRLPTYIAAVLIIGAIIFIAGHPQPEDEISSIAASDPLAADFLAAINERQSLNLSDDETRSLLEIVHTYNSNGNITAYTAQNVSDLIRLLQNSDTFGLSPERTRQIADVLYYMTQ